MSDLVARLREWVRLNNGDDTEDHGDIEVMLREAADELEHWRSCAEEFGVIDGHALLLDMRREQARAESALATLQGQNCGTCRFRHSFNLVDYCQRTGTGDPRDGMTGCVQLGNRCGAWQKREGA